MFFTTVGTDRRDANSKANPARIIEAGTSSKEDASDGNAPVKMRVAIGPTPPVKWLGLRRNAERTIDSATPKTNVPQIVFVWDNTEVKLESGVPFSGNMT